MTALFARAPGKVNLSLFVGAPRADGLHPLVSVVQAVTVADELTLAPAPDGATGDDVVCPGVDGPNLAGRALSAFRAATGWDAPPQRLEIVKRVPVAAGMGGGSADAAAALRLAAHAAGGASAALLHDLAVSLGADVPSLLAPGRVLMTGAGEHVDVLPEPAPFGLVIVPSRAHAVHARRLRRVRPSRRGARRRRARLRADAARAGEPPPPVNDLQYAARSLCPPIDAALADVRAAGAHVAMVSGSGPTVFGLFDDIGSARAAAAALSGRHPEAVAAAPASAAFGEVRAA